MPTRVNPPRVPFWLPASNYYVLAVAVSAASFFIMWAILHDEGEDTPWISAGITASAVLLSSVVLREIIMRRAQRKLVVRQVPIGGHVVARQEERSDKLTLEKNAAILGEIKKKSDAANVLNRLSAGHREVYELCAKYLSRNEIELRTINAGSPRLSALLKGKSAANDFHRYHLLKWAEIEAQDLTEYAQRSTDVELKVEAAREAIAVIESALESYPNEGTLLESRRLLNEMVVSFKVSDFVERAERAVFDGDFGTARGFYREALFVLGRDNIHNEGRVQAAQRIDAELEKLSDVENGS